MKKLSLLLLLFLAVGSSGFSQGTQPKNIIQTDINVPIVIDQFYHCDYKDPGAEDYGKEYLNVSGDISLDLRNASMNVAGDRFSGTWTNPNYPFETIAFNGEVSADRMVLERLYLEKSMHLQDGDYYEEKKSAAVLFENVPMFNGVCKFDKSKSRLKVLQYSFSRDRRSRKYTQSDRWVYKEINMDRIEDHPDLAFIRLQIKLFMDGPASYIIDVEKIRGEQADWEPPISEVVGKEKEATPNSTAIYWDFEGLDEQTDYYAGELASIVGIEIGFHDESWNVYDREFLSLILQEHQLNASPLVDPDMQVESDIGKEELAIFVTGDMSRKMIRFDLVSKKASYRVTVYNVDPENYLNVEEAMWKRIILLLETSFFNN